MFENSNINNFSYEANVLSPENETEELEMVVNDLVLKLQNEVAEKYDNKLAYHNSAHTKEVMEAAGAVLEVLSENGLATERERLLGKLASAAHDLEQGLGAGKNEEASADELIKRMLEAGIFTEADEAAVREGIMVTVAGFADGTVVQKNLNAESGPVAIALALADINESGRDAQKFLADGDKLFAEFKMQMSKKEWYAGQVKFAEARKQKFAEELTMLFGDNEKVQRELAALFGNFDKTIAAAKARLSAYGAQAAA